MNPNAAAAKVGLCDYGCREQPTGKEPGQPLQGEEEAAC